MKRIFDLLAATVLLLFFSIPMLIIAFLIKATSKGPVLFWSDRVGFDNKIFRMPKFRTMRIDTPDIATHLLESPDTYLISMGPCLRNYSLDELPQIWSVLTGDMSLVGPRPALYNQHDLIELRTAKGVHSLVPGITGWAQVNGRDSITIPVKVDYDEYYLQRRSILFDLKILWMTFLKVIKREGVKH